MPPRTNTFQTVVLLIKQHMAGTGVVTESHMLPDRWTGTEREVDITIATEIAGHRVLLGIECRDHKRPQGPAFVEEMNSKHQFLPTTGLILVSSSGFTLEATKKAAVFGIELVTPSQLTKEKVGTIINRLESLTLQGIETKLEEANVFMVTPPRSSAIVHRLEPDVAIYDELGVKMGCIGDLAKMIMQSRHAWVTMQGKIQTGQKFVAAEEPLRVMRKDRGQSSLFFRDEGPTPQLTEISGIEIIASVNTVESEFPLVHRDFDGTPYSYGEGQIDGRKAVLVLTEAEDGTGGRLSMKVT